MSGRYYACQGNTLTGRQVIVAMAQAYEETKGSLADRLMAALVAGDRAGGDHRGRLAAGIRVAKRGIAGLLARTAGRPERRCREPSWPGNTPNSNTRRKATERRARPRSDLAHGSCVRQNAGHSKIALWRVQP